MSDVVTITVAGKSGTGKSAIVRLIYDALASHGVTNVEIDWGMDGDPQRTPLNNCKALISVAERNTPIMICEQQVRRSRYE